jgi:hypothetical protein
MDRTTRSHSPTAAPRSPRSRSRTGPPFCNGWSTRTIRMSRAPRRILARPVIWCRSRCRVMPPTTHPARSPSSATRSTAISAGSKLKAMYDHDAIQRIVSTVSGLSPRRVTSSRKPTRTAPRISSPRTPAAALPITPPTQPPRVWPRLSRVEAKISIRSTAGPRLPSWALSKQNRSVVAAVPAVVPLQGSDQNLLLSDDRSGGDDRSQRSDQLDHRRYPGLRRYGCLPHHLGSQRRWSPVAQGVH